MYQYLRILYLITLTLLSFTFEKRAQALEATDFPVIVRLENREDFAIHLENTYGDKIEVGSNEVIELRVSGQDHWRARYNSAGSGPLALVHGWNLDAALEDSIEACKSERIAREGDDDRLYLCSFGVKFVRKTWAGREFALNFITHQTFNLARKDISKIYEHPFPNAEVPTSDEITAIERQASRLDDGEDHYPFLEKLPGAVQLAKATLLDKENRTEDEIPKNSQNILVMGDQGSGDDKAKLTARNMHAVCFLRECDYAISAGDNIYKVGPKITEDNWRQMFVDKFVTVYQSLWDSFQLPFFLALGNHDIGVNGLLYHDKAYLKSNLTKEHYDSERRSRMAAQVAFGEDQENNPRMGDRAMWNMDSPHYTKLIEENGIKTFLIFLDTNYYPGTLVNHDTPENTAQAKWLLNQLTSKVAKKADWRIVVGHHPLYSVGRHGVNVGKGVGPSDVQLMNTLKDLLEPLMCMGKVDFYITGHDHHMQIDQNHCDEDGGKFVQILSGAAAKGDVGKWHEKTLSRRLFGYDAFSPEIARVNNTLIWTNGFTREEIIEGAKVKPINGFTYLELTKNRAEIQMLKTQSTGPEWIGCWTMDRQPKNGGAPTPLTPGCEKDWSKLFEAPFEKWKLK